MTGHKFHPHLMSRLDDPARLEEMRPDLMWQALGHSQPKVLVEVGAGTGFLAAAVLKLAPGATLYAVDIEPAMLDWMRSHRQEVADGTMIPVLGQESSVPLPDGMADVVFMANLHHELEDPAAVYAEARRLLTGGGRVLVVDWRPVETPSGPPMSIRVHGQVVATMLADAGFLDVEQHEGLPWHWLLTGRRPD